MKHLSFIPPHTTHYKLIVHASGVHLDETSVCHNVDTWLLDQEVGELPLGVGSETLDQGTWLNTRGNCNNNFLVSSLLPRLSCAYGEAGMTWSADWSPTRAGRHGTQRTWQTDCPQGGVELLGGQTLMMILAQSHLRVTSVRMRREGGCSVGDLALEIERR